MWKALRLGKTSRITPGYRLWEKKCEGKMKKYVGNIKEYVEGSGIWKIPSFTSCIGPGT